MDNLTERERELHRKNKELEDKKRQIEEELRKLDQGGLDEDEEDLAIEAIREDEEKQEESANEKEGKDIFDQIEGVRKMQEERNQEKLK